MDSRSKRITASFYVCLFFSGYFRNCLNCDSLRWSHTHFICIPAVHTFHSVFHSFHGLMNSINWPASSIWVFIAQLGEHCSANAEATGSNPVEAPKNLFFGLFSQLLELRFTAMVTYSFHLYSRSSHHFIQCFIPFTG